MAKTFATMNSILLLVPVLAFVANIVLTMRGNWGKVFTNMPLRFTITGFIFYFLVNIQGAIQAIPSFNRVTHFTNFIVAHAHLALLGAFTILGMGVIDYIIPQIFKRPAYSRRLLEWQYWLVTIGFVGFFFSLTFASFLQGQKLGDRGAGGQRLAADPAPLHRPRRVRLDDRGVGVRADLQHVAHRHHRHEPTRRRRHRRYVTSDAAGDVSMVEPPQDEPAGPEHRFTQHPQVTELYNSDAPERRFLMTPAMSAVGALLAFFTVVGLVVVLPVATYDPR